MHQFPKITTGYAPNTRERDPIILLSIHNKSDEKLIRDFLPREYTVCFDDQLEHQNFDLCLIDDISLRRKKDLLQRRKREESPLFLPVILLVNNEQELSGNHPGWDFADDILSVPISTSILRTRIQLLLKNRSYTRQLANQRQKLRRKNEQLQIFEKVIASTNNGVIIADKGEKHNPILFANKAFQEITGYSEGEILGRDCRFLQNDDRNQEGVRSLRQSIEKGESDHQLVRNYTKDGDLFWNEVSIAPIKNEEGEITHFVGIQNDLTQLMKTRQKLEHEKNYIQAVMQSLPGFFYMLNEDLNFVKWNKNINKILGYKDQEIAEMNPIQFFREEDHQWIKEQIQEVFEHGSAQMEAKIQTKNGELLDYFFFAKRIRLNKQTYLIGSGVNIADRIRIEQQLKESVREKEVLLQEIHHRVKNNLAVVSGLLQIQRFNSIDENLCSLLMASEMRIKTMALIHEKLYRAKSLSSITFEDYIRDLISTVKEALNVSQNISVNFRCSDIELNVNQAVPCALIINEMLSNAFKHAFKGEEKGTLSIIIRKENDEISVTIADNGNGLPDDFQISNQTSMGFTIITTLLNQLKADLTIDSANGTSFSFSFQIQDLKGSSSSL